MLDKLKDKVDARLALTVAIGIFGALLAFRLLTTVIDWFALGWDGLTGAQHALLVLPIVCALGVAAIFAVRGFLQAIEHLRALRVHGAAEAKERQEVLLGRETHRRRKQLNEFLQWVKLAEDKGLQYISEDSAMEDPQSQQVLEAMRQKSTAQLLDIVLRNERGEWTQTARFLASQLLLSRAKSPDFAEAAEIFIAAPA